VAVFRWTCLPDLGASLIRASGYADFRKIWVYEENPDTTCGVASRNGKASTSPFGEKIRKQVLTAYFAKAEPVTADAAWSHVYRLLLSIDRRTQLAHVYDANHMQPGGNWHDRAVKFTDILCARWKVTREQLPDMLDVMFRACVDEYLAGKPKLIAKAARKSVRNVLAHAESEDAEEQLSELAVEITELLLTRFGLKGSGELAAVVAEIERKAEDYFTIEKKRQNVRGEGFEDTLEWLLLNTAGVPRQQLVVRKRAAELPGFKKDLPSAGKRKDKVPKPDLAVITADGSFTIWIITAKWSLRQDRLDQFGQEFAYYEANLIQKPRVDFVLVTNEMDIARLRGVLNPPEGGGGFHFNRVYHVNRDLLEATHGARFDELAVYASDRRLLSLTDLLKDAQTQFGR
jgi:hypothetical protein